MASSEATERRGKRSIKRAIIATVVIVLVGGLAGGWFYLQTVATNELTQAMAEADRLDPGWRLSEVMARRAVIPEGKNSAVQVKRVFSELPVKFVDPKVVMKDNQGRTILRGAALLDSLDLVKHPSRQIDPEQTKGLRAELADVAQAVTDARALAEMPRGSNDLHLDRLFLNTRLDHAQNARQVARLLKLDVTLRAQEGDIDGALDSCRAILNVGRSLGDEPLSISQLVRMAITGVAADCVQYVLAQGEASDAALLKVQDLLGDESAQLLALWALRGERAALFDLFAKLESGEVSLSELSDGDSSSASRGVNLVGKALFRYNQGLSLKFMNEAVEIVKQPDREQQPLLAVWDVETRPPPGRIQRLAGSVTYSMIPAVAAVARAQAQIRARLRCAEALVAVERYRKANGRWPETLDQLVPRYLAKLPADPFEDGPVRYTKSDDEEGVVVYSVGQDGTDNHGILDTKFRGITGMDIGYRLWNVDRRHQPPPKPDGSTPQGAADVIQGE
ncbi:MAG TPA: hypothetical protein VGZ22_24360 [Isosphaeraceae bacterium]|jgi:hypothetical protein|nr:hypothetical protein [Isosphaeraceae bacterium]